MKIEFRSNATIKLHGYSPENSEEILTRVLSGAKPSSLKGDFILVAEGTDAATGNPLTIFISTVVSAVPYFLYLTETHCVHSNNVVDCCIAAGLNWQWNWDALAQLALFDHVLGNVSLHQSISRIPAASVIKICGNKIDKFTEPFWTELYETNKTTSKLEDAAPVLLDILSELPANDHYALSLSAGYDSRVLLACMSYLKREITTASMGLSDSTDPRIAQQLAYAMNYDFKHIEINPDDYLTYADHILKTTNGEKLFWHWHTGIYTKKVGFYPSAIHLAGSNGEFARSYYFDKGFIASFIDMISYSRWDYWLMLKNATRRRVAPEIRGAMELQSNLLDRLDVRLQMKSALVPGLCFGDGLDCFYAKERVRHFIGLGLALYRSDYLTISPFLDARFIRYTVKLRRQDKLANRMHRTVIKQLRPELLDFPTDESGVPMRLEPGLFYFLKKTGMKGYSRYQDAQKLPQVINWGRSGFCELGGDVKLFESNDRLKAMVSQWNLAITIGAFSELLSKMRLKLPEF
jgi:hypothetical protein